MYLGRFILYFLLAGLLLGGCRQSAWNNPYPEDAADQNIYYSAFAERPKHLDPARSYSSNEWAFLSQIYEPPLQYHYLKRPAELTPLLATEMPQIVSYDKTGQPLPGQISPDQVAYTEYKIKIRSGVKFQPHPAFAQTENGQYLYFPLEKSDLAAVRTLADFPKNASRELIADDFIYQIKRLADPKTHSPIASIMLDYIAGFSELRTAIKAKRAETKTPWLDLRAFELSGVKIIDPYTFTIRIKGKYPQFNYWLAMNFFAPMPWEADRFYAQPGMKERNLTLHWYPVGTGPYRLTENNPNLRMVLERNPNFRGEPYPSEGEPGDAQAGLLDDAGKTMPFIDKAVYSLEREAIPRWNKFLQGYYDSSAIGSDSFDQAVQFSAAGDAELTEEMREKGIELVTVVKPTSYYMGFNMLDSTVGGYSDAARKLRQAISIAVDEEEYISIFRNNRGIAAQGPLPPGIFGYRAGEAGINPYVYDWVDGKAQRKSLDYAKQLLAQAGYPEGRDPKTGQALVINFESASAGPDAQATHNWYIKQFAKLGIQLVVRATDYNRFQEKMLNGKAQVFVWGWHADYPDPENFLFLLYGPNGKVAHRGENAVNYQSPQFDALFEQMKNMDNGPQRQQVIDHIVDLLRKDSPWSWGFHPVDFSLQQAWYHNIKPHGISKNLLKYRRLDPQRRAEKRAEWNQPIWWPLVVMVLLVILAAIPAVLTYRKRERSNAR